MGIKSTQEITIQEAIKLYVDLKMNEELHLNKLKYEALCMDHEKLENELERMDDKQNDGESFRNYSIIS